LKPAQAKSSQNPICKISNTKKGRWNKAQVVERLPGKREASSPNASITQKKGTTVYRGVVQMAEFLPSKCEALISKPQHRKKKKKRND
jgi:hypothetical protein